MDMSIKLNAYYPPVATQTGSASAVAAQPVVEKDSASTEDSQRIALEKAVADIREFVQSTRRNLDFSIDETTGTIVVKVIATESGEVIRQIPSETLLKLAQDLSNASSLLFDTKA